MTTPLSPTEIERLAERRIARARTQLLLNPKFVFWATCALHLKPTADRGIIAAGGFIGTDGNRLYYDPDFIVSGLPADHPLVVAGDMKAHPPWTDDELIAVIAHETSHAAKGDNWRRGERDPRNWNIACDARINPELDRAGLSIANPVKLSGGPMASLLNNPANFGRSAEEIYVELPPPPTGGGGQGGASPMSGDVRDPSTDPNSPQGPAGAAARQAAADRLRQKWDLISRQAAQIAKARGHLPAGMEHLVEVVRPRLDPYAMLRHFVSMCRKDDYSWSRPQRRSAWRGLYLPSLYSEGVGELLIGIDTSGSCATVVPKFLGFLASVLTEVKPERVHFVECDAKVHNVTTFEAGEELPERVAVHGYGGTSMRPIWEWAEKNDVAPICAIVLTDLEMTDHDLGNPQAFPCLWVSSTRRYAAWGETVWMEE